MRNIPGTITDPAMTRLIDNYVNSERGPDPAPARGSFLARVSAREQEERVRLEREIDEVAQRHFDLATAVTEADRALVRASDTVINLTSQRDAAQRRWERLQAQLRALDETAAYR